MTAPKLLGRTQPRIWTPPLRPLNRRTSDGYAVCDFADTIGEPFLPWQKWLYIHAMELLPDRSYRFRVVIVLVARQNGKSTAKRTGSLWRLHVRGDRLILGVAQDVSLAREQWNYCLDTISASPDLSADLAQVRRVNGDEWFRLAFPDDREIGYDDDEADESLTLVTGGRYKIAASNRKAGRGLSVDELNIDELREQRNWQAWSALSKTTMARPDSQIWCMSNAGDDDSVVLNQLVDAAQSGRDPSIGLFAWTAPDECELDDVKAIQQANPGLGHIISMAAIQTAMVTDPPNVYRTEVLCQRVEQLDGAISYPAWKACADAGGMPFRDRVSTPEGARLRKRLAACFDVSPDGEHCTLALSTRTADGRPRVEIARAWKSQREGTTLRPATEFARAEITELVLGKIKPAAFTWYPAGPAAGMATVLEPIALKCNARYKRRDGDPPEDGRLTGGTVTEVCQELADITRARRIIHPGDDLLNNHVKGAAKLYSGDGWRFTRKGGGHCDAAYAAAGAVSVALAMPEPKRAELRWITG